MATPWKLIVMAAALGSVAACSSEIGGTFTKEAGTQIDDGSFGAATAHNLLAQSCSSAGRTSLKGGAVKDPLVVLDPESTTERPIYRVHCDGQLNGKYARVIWAEYVASATAPPITEITLEAGE